MKCFLLCKLCKILCFPPCPRSIIEHIAFQPPPPTYKVNYNEDTQKYSFEFENKFEMCGLKKFAVPTKKIEFSFVNTKNSTKIACMYYAVQPGTNTTILYSHGNGSDLGTVIGLCVWLATKVHCNILAYDYSGYGHSTGKPSEKRLYKDVEAAFKLLLDQYNRTPEDIILWGQSLGSAATIDLASRVNVRGVVIQSGFISALNVAFPHEEPKSICCDVFENVFKVSKISSPVLVIHGTADDIIDWTHGVALYERCPRAVEPLWIEGGGHNDLELFAIFLERVVQFLSVELQPRSLSFNNIH